MKMNKTKKIVTLTAAMALTLACGAAFMGNTETNALVFDMRGASIRYQESENVKDNGIRFGVYTDATTYANFAPAETIQSADPVNDSSDDSNNDGDDSDDESDLNVWMLISSIIIAAVLLFTVISLAVRKVLDNLRKKRGVIVQPKARLKKDKKTK